MNPNDLGNHIDAEWDAECNWCEWTGLMEAEVWMPLLGDDTNGEWTCPSCSKEQESFLMVGDLRW